MKSFLRTTKSPRVSTALMAVIVGSLCFSVGEGLRLRPFPTLLNEEPGNLSITKEAGKSYHSKYGPLDVPSQFQKRTKRQTIDFAPHPFAESCPVVSRIWYSLADESVELKSFLFVSRPAGRAPPRVS